MAKKVKVMDKRKIRGIRRRWLINSVGVVLMVLVLALATFSAAIWSYYYSSTMSDLQRRPRRKPVGLPRIPAVSTGRMPKVRFSGLKRKQNWSCNSWTLPARCSIPATIWPPEQHRIPRIFEMPLPIRMPVPGLDQIRIPEKELWRLLHQLSTMVRQWLWYGM